MTKAKRRFIVSSFDDDGTNIPSAIYKMLKQVKIHRFMTIPKNLSENARYEAIYGYGDVLLFEMAMLIKGQTLKQASVEMDVPYHTLLRIVNKFNRGRISENQKYPPQKGRAYVIERMIKYSESVEHLIYQQTPEYQRTLYKNRGF